jgi:alpha-beta hydrolase superfamily lysophospholipase
MKIRTGFAISLSAVLLYFGVAACSLRFGLSHLLFPRTSGTHVLPAEATTAVRNKSGNELLVRRYGRGSMGCVVFFPGQHGAAASYDFTAYISAGLSVFSLAYPGQDGALGRAELGEIQTLVGEVLAAVGKTCQITQTVFVGVSLGSMLAAYATQSVRPAGLVLLSAAPSLSAAVRVRLRSRLYLAPLSLLPLSALVPYDYSLADSIGRTPSLPVVIFQGTEDEQTPLVLLRDVASVGQMKLIEVPGGTHSTTFALSRAAQVSTILGMLAAH